MIVNEQCSSVEEMTSSCPDAKEGERNKCKIYSSLSSQIAEQSIMEKIILVCIVSRSEGAK